MRPIQVSGYGNAILDILVRAQENDITRLGLKKGDMQLVDATTQNKLLSEVKASEPVLVSGGALVNSLIAFAQLGGKAALSARIGDDRYGLHYQQEMTQLGIELDVPLVFNEQTGTSLIMITPDSERTMCTNLAVSATLSDQHINVERLAQSDWLAVEGYLLSSPEGQSVARLIKQNAKKFGCRLLTTIAAQFIATVFRAELEALISGSDMILANLDEARVFIGSESIDAVTACKFLSEMSPEVVITDGANGAYGVLNGEHWHVPAVPSKPVDLTGAGDMFTGVYLFGRCNNFGPVASATAACQMSHKVIEQIGARLPEGMPKNLFN